jgi:hypothetical protein
MDPPIPVDVAPVYHRALGIPYVLENILLFLFEDRGSTLSCALVSKWWSAPALDVLWDNLDSPLPLFLLLAPMKVVGEDEVDVFNDRPVLEEASPLYVCNFNGEITDC